MFTRICYTMVAEQDLLKPSKSRKGGGEEFHESHSYHYLFISADAHIWTWTRRRVNGQGLE